MMIVKFGTNMEWCFLCNAYHLAFNQNVQTYQAESSTGLDRQSL